MQQSDLWQIGLCLHDAHGALKAAHVDAVAALCDQEVSGKVESICATPLPAPKGLASPQAAGCRGLV